MLHAVIMAGGGGTRFWPRSRSAKPKQFLALSGDRSLLQLAFDRLECQVSPSNTWVITAERHCTEAARHLPKLPRERIIGEPCGRDTAACIGLGAALIAKNDPDAVMIVTPADHIIEPVREFERALQAATLAVEDSPHSLITFGIPPTYPATGYGYIHRGAEVARRQGVSVYQVKQFREKPSAELAEQFLTSGDYYWNSGIFVWRAATILAELKRNKPSLADSLQVIAAAWGTPDGPRVLSETYPKLEKISIDFAVMEHAQDVLVLQAPYRWDDVGSWLALERMHAQDAEGNTIEALHEGIQTSNCVIVGDPSRLITTIGVSNLLIVQDGDATLVADRRDEATVKQLVDRLKQKGLEKYL